MYVGICIVNTVIYIYIYIANVVHVYVYRDDLDTVISKGCTIKLFKRV